MGNHENCADWDYETHPKQKTLKGACDRLTAAIAKNPEKFNRFGFDTRPAHRFLFKPFVPKDCTCLAGTYRGSPSCPELHRLDVGVRGTAVGTPAAFVEMAMHLLDERCKSLLAAYAARVSAPGADEALAFALLVDVLCDLLELFFSVHPYANGNGHMGRLLAWALFAQHGFAPRNWSVDSKQPYGKALDAYRKGDRRPLRLFLVKLSR